MVNGAASQSKTHFSYGTMGINRNLRLNNTLDTNKCAGLQFSHFTMDPLCNSVVLGTKVVILSQGFPSNYLVESMIKVVSVCVN